jgi:hypothetical protein
MDVHRFGVKFFAAAPLSFPLSDFAPVFHGWIQKQNVTGHLLIDVHNYSHIHQGPGILLVAHEGNFSLDMAEGRPGLMYLRKAAGEGAPEDRLAAVLETALQVCKLLEEESGLPGKVRFLREEALLVVNDRLLAPNNEATFSLLLPVLEAAFRKTFGARTFKFVPSGGDSRERFAVRVNWGG